MVPAKTVLRFPVLRAMLTLVILLLLTAPAEVADRKLDRGDCALVLAWPEAAAALGLTSCNTSISCDALPFKGKLKCNKKGRITELVLSNTSISGGLRSEWSKLEALEKLDLSYNNITGTIPRAWGNFKNLKYMALNDNHGINGTLPAELGKLAKLQYMNIVNASLTGTLPREWSGLTSLVFMRLANNRLHGPIPAEWGNLTNLLYLSIRNNGLTGAVPDTWSHLNLRYLNIANNQLSGPLPPLPMKLVYFTAFNNSLNGSVPTLPASLVSFYAAHNKFQGPAPSLNASSAMEFFDGTNNSFDQLPRVLAAPNLTYFALAQNNVTGSLPASGYSPSIDIFDVSNNSLSGTISEIWYQRNFSYFGLSHNQFTGELPANYSGNVKVMLLQNNSITGCVSEGWVHNSTLRVVSLSNNKIQCSKGLPGSWAEDGSFPNLALIALGGNARNLTVRVDWLGKESFKKNSTQVLMDRPQWDTSKHSSSWREKVCTLDDLNKRLALNLDPASLEKAVQEEVQPFLEALLAGVITTINSIIGGFLNQTMPEYFNDQPYQVSPSSFPRNLTMRLSAAEQPTLNSLCGNQAAKTLVKVLWGGGAGLMLLMVCVYLAEVRAKLVSAMCILWCRTWRGVMERRGSSSARSAAAWAGFQALQIAKALLVLFTLLLYWFDLVVDALVLKKVWDNSGSRPGWRWGLLSIMLFHYVVAAGLITWKLIATHNLSHWLSRVLAVVLIPFMPLLDTLMFLALFYTRIRGAPGSARGLQRGHLNHSHSLLGSSAELWQELFHMRDVLEVLLEAVPTAVVQAVVFVAGNTPQSGIYFDTKLYLLSALGSCFQILRLLAVILWKAWDDRTSPVGALLNRTLGQSGRKDGLVATPTIEIEAVTGPISGSEAHRPEHPEGRWASLWASCGCLVVEHTL